MCCNWSMETIYHVWERLSTTQRVYRGTVTAISTSGASQAARQQFGASRYILRTTKHGRIVNAWA